MDVQSGVSDSCCSSGRSTQDLLSSEGIKGHCSHRTYIQSPTTTTFSSIATQTICRSPRALTSVDRVLTTTRLKLCLVTLLTLASIGQVAARPVADDDVSKPTSVEKLFYRQTPVQRSCQTDTFLVGDGDPHQNSYEIQVTETIDCGAGGAGCSVSRLNSHTVSWTASATVNIGSWFSGGFAVTEAVTSGGTYTCKITRSLLLHSLLESKEVLTDAFTQAMEIRNRRSASGLQSPLLRTPSTIKSVVCTAVKSMRPSLMF